MPMEDLSGLDRASFAQRIKADGYSDEQVATVFRVIHELLEESAHESKP